MRKFFEGFYKQLPLSDWIVVIAAIFCFVPLALWGNHFYWQLCAPVIGAAMGIAFCLHRKSSAVLRIATGTALLAICVLCSFLWAIPSVEEATLLEEYFLIGISDIREGINYDIRVFLIRFIFSGLGFLVGASAAQVGKNWRFAIPVAATIFLLLPFPLLLGAIGLAALSGAGSVYHHTSWLSVSLLLALLLCTIISNLFLIIPFTGKKQRQWGRFVIVLAAIILSMAVFWGAAWSYEKHRADKIIRLAESMNLEIPQERQAAESLNAVKTAYDAISDFEKFPPPSASVATYWLPQNDGVMATEEEKQNVFSADQSVEINRFYDAFEQLLREDRLIMENDLSVVQDCSYLNSFREYSRRCIGRAQLAHYSGEPEKAIYWVERAIRFGEVWTGEISIISQLVLVGIDQIALSGAVSLTPNDPKYLDIYRGWLRHYSERRYNRVGVPEEFSELLKLGNRAFMILKYSEPNWYFRVFSPLSMRALCDEFEDNVQADRDHAQARINLAENRPAYPKDSRSSAFFQNISLKMLRSEAISQTAMALKVYRVKHSRYPDSLDQLVPELLEKLPLDPVTAKPLEYTLQDGEFELKNSGDQPPFRSKASY